ncbi:MAG: very-short-patch-repair endonuclease [Candidatus Azotimanducaceae bacterium]|jgi:very-short-patch-repair endonuclease
MRSSSHTLRRFYPFGFIASTILFLYGCSQESYEAQFLTDPEAAGASEHRVSWHEVTDKHRCYLKIQRQWRSAFRVNYFQIDGELHTHSNRFVEYNQKFTHALGFGDAWVYVVADKPDLLVAIDGEVHEMRTELISAEERRTTILLNRGYDPVPEAIRVYRLVSAP